MSVIDTIKVKSKQEFLKQQVKFIVKYVQKDPEKNFDALMKRMIALDDVFGGFGNFRAVMEWIQENPGTRKWFMHLMSRDQQQVSTLINNFFGNCVLRWQEQSRHLFAEHGVTPPFTVLFSPTMRCNLQCVGCYAKDYQREKDMDPQLMEKILSEGKQLGTYFYTVLGGEPFFHFDKLYPLFKKHNDCLFQVFTNGSLITDEVADKLQELKNVIVAVSVNGTKEDTDYMRGPGVYERILKSVERMRQRKLIYGASFVLTSKNYDTLMSKEFLKFWEDQGISYGWNFLYMPVGDNPDLSLMPTPEQRLSFGEFIKTYREQEPLYIMDFWADAPASGGCIAGRRYMHVTPSGDVEPCIFAHHATHNLKRSSMLEIMKSPFFTFIRMHQPHTDNLLRPCMIIDNPQTWRDACKMHAAQPTDAGAAELISKPEMVEGLDRYSQAAARHIDPYYHQYYQETTRAIFEEEKSYDDGLDRMAYKINPQAVRERVKLFEKDDPEYARMVLHLLEYDDENYGKDWKRQPQLLEALMLQQEDCEEEQVGQG